MQRRNCKKKQTKTCRSPYARLTQTIGLHKKKLLKIIEKYVKEHPATLAKIGQEDEQEEANGYVGKRKDSQTSLTQNPKKAKKSKQRTEEEEEAAAEQNEDDQEEAQQDNKEKIKSGVNQKNKNHKPAPPINSGVYHHNNPDYRKTS